MGKIFFSIIMTFILLFLLFSCERIQPAEEGVIKFIVKDKFSTESISGAQIKITQNGDLKVSAFTDENGEYNFTLAEGDYNYEVIKLNYFPVNGEAKVYANETRTANVLLEPTNKPPIINDYHKPNVDTVVGTKVLFEWEAYDPEGSPLTFDFYLSDIYDEVNNLIKNTYTSTNLNTKLLKDVILNYSSTYYWRIVAKDGMYEIPGPIWSFNFTKKEEGTLPDLYFNIETMNLNKNSTTSFMIKSSFSENIYGFDIRIGYDPLFITINPDECFENNTLNNTDFHIIKKIIKYDDHNEFIFSVVSNSNNFIIPENPIEIILHSINNGNTKINFEKSAYIFGPNEPEILFSTGDSITVTISE
ncbi:hypothetical protein JCM30566_16770 [Marinitoga arctica]